MLSAQAATRELQRHSALDHRLAYYSANARIEEGGSMALPPFADLREFIETLEANGELRAELRAGRPRPALRRRQGLPVGLPCARLRCLDRAPCHAGARPAAGYEH